MPPRSQVGYTQVRSIDTILIQLAPSKTISAVLKYYFIYNSTAPATMPMTPAAEPAILKFVAIAPEPEVVLLALPEEAAVFVASATLMPYPVVVSTVVLPPVVTVVVITEVAVVEAVQPVQVVHGTLVADVQPGNSLA